MVRNDWVQIMRPRSDPYSATVEPQAGVILNYLLIQN